MFGLGMGELVVILFIILILFGAKNMPEMAKSLGKSVREFKKAANEIRTGIDVDVAQANTEIVAAESAAKEVVREKSV